jgi:hypothetical protein
MPAGYHGVAFRSFRLAVLALVAPIAQAETGPHPEIRQAVLDSFQYFPVVVQAKSLEQPVPDLAPPVESGPATMVLPKFEVRSSRLPRGLEEAVAKSQPDGLHNDIKLGTGVHVKDFGKVRVAVATVLYIPIYIGFSW